MNQTTLPASWEICIQVKKQQLEPNMEQWTGSKLAKECIKAAKNTNNHRYADDITLFAESKKELKRLLMKVKEESEKLT